MNRVLTTKEKMDIALKHVEKAYDSEQMWYGDDLYHATDKERGECVKYWEECRDIGMKLFRQKILLYTSND